MHTSIELKSLPSMDRVTDLFHSDPAYERIQDDQHDDDADSISSDTQADPDSPPFSWIEYSIFLLLGVAMLWAWYVLRPPAVSHVMTSH
jgi:solute carrier family 29 (equilibrative nucleoside transporter), member 1/2/3